MINLPVAVIMLGLMGLEALALKAFLMIHDLSFLMGLSLVLMILFVPMAVAWLYWSYAVPRWKLWAYSRVEDVRALKIAAIKAGLIWPDGHLFEKTEICSKAVRQQILKLEGRLP